MFSEIIIKTKTISTEAFFVSILEKLTISLDVEYLGNIIFKDIEGFTWMYYNKKNDILYVSYESIWNILYTEYNMKYSDTQTLILDMLWKHLKWKVKTPLISLRHMELLLWKHLKWKVKTPFHNHFLKSL
jgi:hypothetical protein